MKNTILLSILIVISFCKIASGQCGADALASVCIPKLASSGFNFLKSYKIDGEPDLTKVEYSYVFAKGTQYMISICDQNTKENTITITLYDAQRNKVASNKVDGKLLSAIAYPCNATGIYYLQYTFKKNLSRCGGSVLGFRR